MNNKQYNLYNFEAPFKKYLLAGNISPVSIKNYLSDFRHFTGWMTFYLKSSNVIPSASEGSSEQSERKNASLDFSASPRNDIDSLINLKTVNEYKSYLVENNLPIKTINRRLSTIRKFCSFCISQGWMKENPAKKISNVIPAKAGIQNNWIPYQVRDDILTQFESDLIKENLDQEIIKSYLDDTREYLSS